MAGMMVSHAQSVPNSAVSCCRFLAAAVRIVAMSSPSQFTQMEANLSVKKYCPSCRPSKGMCSIVLRRILHWLSCARSRMAGSNDCDRRFTPTTSSSAPNDEIKFNRTSDAASRSSSRIGGTRCVMVASLPIIGANSVATIASAARTCSLSSSVNVVTLLTSRSAAVTRGPWYSTLTSNALPSGLPGVGTGTMAPHRATDARLNVAAVRTSASGSCNRRSYAGTNESITFGNASKAEITCANLAAAVHRTLHDRSSIVATTNGSSL
mmetsp:Transcript_10812/g.30969  ORF Transcript_10812/g.30969 Transcript_10812/m.30969 type:complete len:266 (-) Transcript_10812:972-1769(-)